MHQRIKTPSWSIRSTSGAIKLWVRINEPIDQVEAMEQHQWINDSWINASKDHCINHYMDQRRVKELMNQRIQEWMSQCIKTNYAINRSATAPESVLQCINASVKQNQCINGSSTNDCFNESWRQPTHGGWWVVAQWFPGHNGWWPGLLESGLIRQWINESIDRAVRDRMNKTQKASKQTQFPCASTTCCWGLLPLSYCFIVSQSRAHCLIAHRSACR